MIFRDLYQEEIDRARPNVAKELAEKVASLEKDKKSLLGALNELKGRMLESKALALAGRTKAKALDSNLFQ